MVKLLLLILIGLALTLFGYKAFLTDDSPIDLPGTQSTSPTDTIDGAKDAVQQGQNVQNRLNDYTGD